MSGAGRAGPRRCDCPGPSRPGAGGEVRLAGHRAATAGHGGGRQAGGRE